MSKKIMIIVSIVVLIVVAGAAFYGGMFYAKSQNVRPAFNAANFQGARANRTGGGNFVSGALLSKDNDSITISLPTGGSKIVFYSDATQIQYIANADANSLLEGNCQLVDVSGVTNSDGSITAKSIQIRDNPSCMPTSRTSAK